MNELKYAGYFPQAPRCPSAIGFGVGPCCPSPHCAIQIEFSGEKAGKHSPRSVCSVWPMPHHGLACWCIPDGTSLGHCKQNGGSARPPSGGVSKTLLRTRMSTLIFFGMSGMSSGPTRVSTVIQAVDTPEDSHGIVMMSHMTVRCEVMCRCPDLHQECPPPHRHEAPSS